MPDFYNIPIHEGSPDIVNAVVEITKGTSAKYEYDEQLNLFRLDRCLLSAMTYPANYGFIPSTMTDDGDALDIMIYCSTPVLRGTLVECRVLGCLDMTDAGDKDYKIIASPVSHHKQYNNLNDIDSGWLDIASNFFSHYKDLSGKQVDVTGWMSREQAIQIVNDSTVK